MVPFSAATNTNNKNNSIYYLCVSVDQCFYCIVKLSKEEKIPKELRQQL